MSKKKDESRAKATGAKLATGAALGAYAGSAAGPPGALLGALTGTLTASVAEVGGLLVKWRQDKFVRWWERVLKRYAGADLQDVIRNKPEAKSAIMESVRNLERSTCDEVVPILRDLTADYLQGDDSADWFFRGFSRMLSDLTAPELSDLERLLAALQDKEAGRRLHVQDHDDIGKPTLRLEEERSAYNTDGPIGDYPHFRRLVHAMSANGIGESISATGPHLAIKVETVRRMAKYVLA